MLYQQLDGSKYPQDERLRRFLFINAGRFDLLDNNKRFVGTQFYSPQHGYYPERLTREQIEKYVREHPDKKAELYSPYTVIRRRGDELVGVPYSVAYRSFLEPCARALREAAALSPDKSFAEFLRARAAALLSDNYYPSDLAWIDLDNPKFDVIFAPYETYLDDILGVKTSFGAAVLIRNEAESKKLGIFQQYIPEIQDALPLPPEDRPSKKGMRMPMEVMDAPFRTGDFTHGYQAVADNLPNDPRIHQEKGTKKIFFKNFMDARVDYIILPLARRMMRPDQAAEVTGAGYLEGTLMHEIAHGLGPAFARANGQQVDIREAMGPLFSPLEESKADVVGVFGLMWLMGHGYIPKNRAPSIYASYVADMFRTARFGVAESHARGQVMQFSFLMEQGAIKRDSQTGRYIIDYDKMPATVTALAKELLEIEATGDRARGEKWFDKYARMPAGLEQSLASSGREIPVDITPFFSFPIRVQ
jgi:hypothetical protein